MTKTLKSVTKREKEKFSVPKRVQDVIPIRTVYADGVFQVGKERYSKTWIFTDINYAVASKEDKTAMFLDYSELLNSLDPAATTKITINNRRLNKIDFENSVLIKERGDGLDEFRQEYNGILQEKANSVNAMIQEKYITVTAYKKTYEDAKAYFARIGAELIAHFSKLGSRCHELTADDRLRIFHDFYRSGEETLYYDDLFGRLRKGHDVRDYISPDSFEFHSDHFRMGDRYGRVIFLRDYASYIKDKMVSEIMELNRNMMLSIDVIPVPTDEAVKEAESRLLGVETNISATRS